ncbi:MAG: hypothetical protein NTZ48_05285, partial [Candidatus Omnitrophica bacterium]|nr:hypothetical protein [Candidatus Omnitrophota bacterium]
MKKNIRSERGREERKDKILNRFLWGLGFVIIALFLAVGLKSILKPAMQEAMPIAKEMAEPQGKLAQQEKEESVFEEEFSQAPISPAAGGMKQIARASSREEREIVQNQPAFVKELEEAGIEVKEIKPAESTNKLFASNPKAITHYMKIINETKPATDTALPHVPGEILVSEITSSGTIEFSTVKVEPGTEAEAIDVLSGLPGTRAELNSLFRIFMLGYPQNDEPNDREYGKQWGLGKIGILGAWDKAKGKDASPEEVIIAILDT